MISLSPPKRLLSLSHIVQLELLGQWKGKKHWRALSEAAKCLDAIFFTKMLHFLFMLWPILEYFQNIKKKRDEFIKVLRLMLVVLGCYIQT